MQYLTRVIPVERFANRYDLPKHLPGLTKLDKHGAAKPREWSRWQVGEVLGEDPKAGTYRIRWHVPMLDGPGADRVEQDVPKQGVRPAPSGCPLPQDWQPGLVVEHVDHWQGLIDTVDWNNPHGPIVVRPYDVRKQPKGYAPDRLRIVGPPSQEVNRLTESLGPRPDASKLEEIRQVPLHLIGHAPGGNQRTNFDQGKLEELAQSIRGLGLIQPLTVNELDGRYYLIAGERRLRAAGLAGLAEVPCRVLHLTEEQALEAMLVENIQREDLNPIEEANAYKRLLAFEGATQAGVAARVGKPREHVNEMLQLLELPPEMQYQVASRSLARRAALEYLRATRSLPEPVRERVAQELTDKKPTARQARETIDRALDREGVARTTPPASASRPQQTAPAQPAAPPPPPPQPPAAPPVYPAAEIAAAAALAAPERPPDPQVPDGSGIPGDPGPMRLVAVEHWSPPSDEEYETVFDFDGYAPIQTILESWEARMAVGAAYLPRGFGTVEIDLPLHGVWIHGRECAMTKPPQQYQPEDLCLVVKEDQLRVRCAGGYVAGRYFGAPAYYRIALFSARNRNHRMLRQQIVVRDRHRLIVVRGSDSVNIVPDQITALERLLRERLSS